MGTGLRSPRLRVATLSPTLIFLRILLIVFTVEFLIMSALASLPERFRGSVLYWLLDSTALVAVLCPALWVLVVRPLRSMVNERGELLRQSISIQEEERARVSRDLHDELGQAQTAVLLGLRTVMNSGSLDEARQRASGTLEIASEAVESTRRIARGLSPVVLRDFGLAAALERICEDMESAGGATIQRDLRIGGLRIDPQREIAIYRVVQEALTNAFKHSRASRIQVDLVLERNDLIVTVQDNGQSERTHEPPASSVGLGIANMRERIILVGGQFEFTTDAHHGTRVRARIPVR